MDLYLRAGNAGALAQACPFLRYEDENGNRHWAETGDDFIVDVIGQIELKQPVLNKFGVQTQAPVVDTGFHINLRCSEELAAQVPETVRVHPSTPRRVWA